MALVAALQPLKTLNDLLPEFDFSTTRRRLRAWYRQHARSLPWRDDFDAYRIWISEIMLQQTTVKAVVPFFERFMERFPSVQDLAVATEGEVLQYWEGLGYYSRGRNVRRAAMEICERYEGEFPQELSALQKLPGIGRYTAGAIRSFAHNLPAPIVEANTQRLYCRLLGYADSPTTATGQRLLWKFAELLQPRQNPRELNQALMELGSLVCRPQAPDCEHCPLIQQCRAFQTGQQADIPLKKQRPVVTQLVESTIALRCHVKGQVHYLLRRRSEQERWSGLWDFPRFPVSELAYAGKLHQRNTAGVAQELMNQLQAQFGLQISSPELLYQRHHSVTRYRIRLLCFVGDVCQHSTPSDDCAWFTLAEIDELPMPVTGRHFATQLRTVAPSLFTPRE